MENNTQSYQTVLLIPENEWLLVKSQLKELQDSTNVSKESTQKQSEDEINNSIIPYDEACKFLGIDKASLVRAKNQGRIKGIRGHSKGFSYRMGDLIQYKKNCGRKQKAA
jgi:hypothetical protein